MAQKQYLCIDLKSFYASVECVERGLDPLTTNLLVADPTRTEKTICLAVSPSLKSYGIPGRPRLFEVTQKMREVNRRRLQDAPEHTFRGSSYDDAELQKDPSLAVDFVIAPPRMAYYMEYSTRIYGIYLNHVAPEDLYVYSIDEVFMDITPYLHISGKTPREFARDILRDVMNRSGITATAGIGTNLYLAKIAMDITAKKLPADQDGVRIAELDEISYRKQLWDHRPLTDFWRVGRGYASKLERYGMYTMGDIAMRSTDKQGEELLYRLFGVNAELLIDHAWGTEPCTLAQIKAYKPASNSISTGQVLQSPYTCEKAKLIVREMTDLLVLDLVDKGLVTDQLTLTIGYDVESLTDPVRRAAYRGEVVADHYGRLIPKHAHGTANLRFRTASTTLILKAVTDLYEHIVNPQLLVRRITVAAYRVLPESSVAEDTAFEQLEMFVDYEAKERQKQKERDALAREKRLQKTLLGIKKKYGKNMILKGMNFEEGATAKDRNRQIGGHKA